MQALSCSEQMLFPLLPNTFSSWVAKLLTLEGQGIRISIHGLEMVVQWLSAQTTFIEELSLVHSTHSGGRGSQPPITSDPLYLTSLYCGHVHTCTHTHNEK